MHKYCGILSAYGLGMADVVQEHEEPLLASLSKQGIFAEVEARFKNLIERNQQGLVQSGFSSE